VTVEHLAASAAPEKVAGILSRDGCCIVDRLVRPEVMSRLRSELAPHFERTEPGRDEFTGKRTRRVGGLIGRSQTARELVENPLVLGAARQVLAHARNFQLHLTQLIAIGPGETPQAIHRDQWAFDFFPFPNGYEVQCNTLWAMSAFDERNGATRVIPGSHLYDDRLEFTEVDTEPAEMEVGSVLLYTGALYHGGGANRTHETRHGVNITYNLAWLRQEENQYLSVPREIATELPESLLRLMGYAKGAYALGYIDDLRDPIEAVRPELSKTRTASGELEQARESMRVEAERADREPGF
jgi:ectoine hydroxylase-related dioxygenase (phytanoyl-CoA dioxygenase family)